MSATLDIETEIYTAILDNVLLADPDWANLFASGNIVRTDKIQGIEPVRPLITGEGDYPQAVLWLRSGNTNLWEGSPTFATFSNSPPANWLENHEYVYRLELTSELQNISEPDILGAQSRAAFRKKGMRLGITDFQIVGIRLSWETARVTTEEEDKIRWRTAINIFLKVNVDGANLQ